MKRSPGPWKPWRHFDEVALIEDADGSAVCLFVGEAAPDCRNAEANARLIAAAPELHQLLKEAYTMLLRIPGMGPLGPLMMRTHALLAEIDEGT